MATQKRSSSGKRTTTGKKTTAGGRRTAAPKKRPIRREVGGVVCLVLALCIAFSYFQQGGWLLDRPAALCRGLVGYGYYTVAPVLLLVSYILLFHRGRNVTACVVGAALLPVLLGAMLHLVLCKTDYNSVDGIAKLLWQSGLSMESGGVLSATLAIMLVKLVKKTLAMILLAVLLVTCLMLAFRLTPAAVLEAVRSHERVPYEPEDDEEEAPPTRAAATKSAEKSKACIDIPLDGETREPPKKEGKLSGFFTHKSDAVRTPDELLTAKAPAGGSTPAPAPEPTYTVVAGAPLTETAPAPAPQPATVQRPTAATAESSPGIAASAPAATPAAKAAADPAPPATSAAARTSAMPTPSIQPVPERTQAAATPVSTQPQTARPRPVQSRLASGISISALINDAAPEPDTETAVHAAAPQPVIDPLSAEKLETTREKILTLVREMRPRFVAAFERMQFQGHVIRIAVPSEALREEILRNKTELLLRIAETSGVQGMLELDVTINEEIRAARPIKLEDRVKYMTEKNPLLAELRRALDLEVE